jgi:hypothetical protein
MKDGSPGKLLYFSDGLFGSRAQGEEYTAQYLPPFHELVVERRFSRSLMS